MLHYPAFFLSNEVIVLFTWASIAHPIGHFRIWFTAKFGKGGERKSSFKTLTTAKEWKEDNSADAHMLSRLRQSRRQTRHFSEEIAGESGLLRVARRKCRQELTSNQRRRVICSSWRSRFIWCFSCFANLEWMLRNLFLCPRPEVCTVFSNLSVNLRNHLIAIERKRHATVTLPPINRCWHRPKPGVYKKNAHSMVAMPWVLYNIVLSTVPTVLVLYSILLVSREKPHDPGWHWRDARFRLIVSDIVILLKDW